MGNWNRSAPPGGIIAGDADDDGFVGLDDLNLVLQNWNAGTPPTAQNVSEALVAVSSTNESEPNKVATQKTQPQQTSLPTLQVAALAGLHSPSRTAFTAGGYTPVIGIWEDDNDTIGISNPAALAHLTPQAD